MTWQTTTSLLPHQVPAVEKMLPTRVGGLFMDMGVGKTRVAIELMARRQQRVRRAIIYCPVSLKETWAAEIAKHTDCPETAVNVFDDKTSIRNLPRSAFWHIIGIESVSSSDRVALAAHDLTTTETAVIVDESSYIKGHNALRTQRITRYSELARYRLALTGTPMSQGVQDLYAQMRFLSPKILGYNSFYSFAANHLEYSEKYPGLVVQAHNVGWLAAKMQPYVYQVTKEEAGLNLPKKLYDSRYFGLTLEQQEAYEQAKHEILFSVEDDEIDSYVIFQLFGALQQIVSGFWNRDGRLLEFPHFRADMTLDAIRSLPAEEKVIIWCKYRYSVNHVADALAGEYGRSAVSLYYGDLSEAERAAELKRWRGNGRFLVASMATGGHGLTLTESAYSIFYENEFKYAHRLQAEDRIHRIGQGRRPTYIDVVARCGIEERIQSSMARKGDAVRDFRRKVDAIKAKKRGELKKEIARLL
jgi:SNF2 family DNA or RNA helicase